MHIRGRARNPYSINVSLATYGVWLDPLLIVLYLVLTAKTLYTPVIGEILDKNALLTLTLHTYKNFLESLTAEQKSKA